MIRLDPLTQTTTTTTMPAAAPPRQVQAEPDNVTPAEETARFVDAASRAGDAIALESGYAAVRVRRRLTGEIASLSDLDNRLFASAASLRNAGSVRPAPVEDADAARLATEEARMAELRAAAQALNVAIGGARTDVAAVLSQLRAELVAAMEALAKGGKASPGLTNQSAAAAATASGAGEALVQQASALSARRSIARKSLTARRRHADQKRGARGRDGDPGFA
ncbi:MAG: hypothetical protein ACK5LJ_09085 [Paracoccus sp. (in: a-proteobacteria)]